LDCTECGSNSHFLSHTAALSDVLHYISSFGCRAFAFVIIAAENSSLRYASLSRAEDAKGMPRCRQTICNVLHSNNVHRQTSGLDT
jgi:hypothetical protein